MNKTKLMKGNEAMSEAAVQAGLDFYAGYPITPQNEVSAYLSSRLPEEDKVFIQAESEIAAINMVFGASASGVRAMTSSSSPGISLKQEGISYIAAAELPCVIVNVMRGGPGLGNIAGSQGDYFQATRGGGHGDYRLIVLSPASVQEMYDFTFKAFDLADKYSNPVMILADGILGQMAEQIELKPYSIPKLPKKSWALTGCKGRKPNVVRTLYLHPEDGLEKVNLKLEEKYKKIGDEIQDSEEYHCDDAELIIVAYGVPSRVARSVVKKASKEDMKIGLFRPKLLWPFPSSSLKKLGKSCKKFLVLEMSNGQMIEDVKLSLFNMGDFTVEHFGIGGGWVPRTEEVLEKVKNLL